MPKLTGLAIVLFGLSAATAFAQAPAEPSPLPPAPPEINRDNPPPPPPPPARGPGREMGQRADMDHRPPHSPERGARFHIEEGRTRIDLRCADGDSTKECGDVLVQILDRLQGSTSDDNDTGRSYRDRDDDRDRPRDR